MYSGQTAGSFGMPYGAPTTQLSFLQSGYGSGPSYFHGFQGGLSQPGWGNHPQVINGPFGQYSNTSPYYGNSPGGVSAWNSVISQDAHFKYQAQLAEQYHMAARAQDIQNALYTYSQNFPQANSPGWQLTGNTHQMNGVQAPYFTPTHQSAFSASPMNGNYDWVLQSPAKLPVTNPSPKKTDHWNPFAAYASQPAVSSSSSHSRPSSANPFRKDSVASSFLDSRPVAPHSEPSLPYPTTSDKMSASASFEVGRPGSKIHRPQTSTANGMARPYPGKMSLLPRRQSEPALNAFSHTALHPQQRIQTDSGKTGISKTTAKMYAPERLIPARGIGVTDGKDNKYTLSFDSTTQLAYAKSLVEEIRKKYPQEDYLSIAERAGKSVNFMEFYEMNSRSAKVSYYDDESSKSFSGPPISELGQLHLEAGQKEAFQRNLGKAVVAVAFATQTPSSPAAATKGKVLSHSMRLDANINGVPRRVKLQKEGMEEYARMLRAQDPTLPPHDISLNANIVDYFKYAKGKRGADGNNSYVSITNGVNTGHDVDHMNLREGTRFGLYEHHFQKAINQVLAADVAAEGKRAQRMGLLGSQSSKDMVDVYRFSLEPVPRK